MSETVADRRQPLAVGSIGYRSSGWWGACFLLMSEASVFAYLFFTYFFFAVLPQGFGVGGARPGLAYPAAQSAVILLGCGTVWWASRAAARAERLRTLLALAATIVLGGAFIVCQLLDWHGKPFSLSSDAYGSVYFTISGFHLAHFVIGWIVFAALFAWTALGYFDAVRHVPITIGALYWYFLAATWLAVFFVLDLTPYLT